MSASRGFGAAIAIACLLGFALESQAETPYGVFYDHRGDGAVEIGPCGSKLCGHVVWVREGVPATACGMAIIGDVANIGDGVWDGGWILDPEFGQKFDVEITPLGGDEIQVVGYMGTKVLSETFVWKKAPSDLPRCQPLQQGDIATAR